MPSSSDRLGHWIAGIYLRFMCWLYNCVDVTPMLCQLGPVKIISVPLGVGRLYTKFHSERIRQLQPLSDNLLWRMWSVCSLPILPCWDAGVWSWRGSTTTQFPYFRRYVNSNISCLRSTVMLTGSTAKPMYFWHARYVLHCSDTEGKTSRHVKIGDLPSSARPAYLATLITTVMFLFKILKSWNCPNHTFTGESLLIML